MGLVLDFSGQPSGNPLEIEKLKQQLRTSQLAGQTTQEELDKEMGASLSETYVGAARLWTDDDFSSSLTLLEDERNRRRELGYETPKLDGTINALNEGSGFSDYKDSLFTEARTALTMNTVLDNRANRTMLGMDFTKAQQLKEETEKTDLKQKQADAKAAANKLKTDADASIRDQEKHDIDMKNANQDLADAVALAQANELEKQGKLDEAAAEQIEESAQTYKRYLDYQGPLAAIKDLLDRGAGGDLGKKGREGFDLYITGSSRYFVDYGEPTAGDETVPRFGEYIDRNLAPIYQAELAALRTAVTPMIAEKPEVTGMLKPMSDTDVEIGKIIVAGGDPNLGPRQMYDWLHRLDQGYLRLADDAYVRMKQAGLKGIKKSIYPSPEQPGGYRVASGKVRTKRITIEEFRNLSDEEQIAYNAQLDLEESEEWYAQ